MPNQILVHDSFESLGNNVTVAGRVPPISDSGQAWVLEGGTTATGDGAGNVKFGQSNAVIKTTSLNEICAVRAVVNDGGDANGATLVLGDSSTSTVFPRYCYTMRCIPRSSIVRFMRYDNYVSTQLGSDITVQFNVPDDNTIIFERTGNTTFRGIVNGVEVGSFSDFTYQPNGGRRAHGYYPSPYVDGTARLRDFQILDSVDLTPPVDLDEDPQLYAHYTMDAANIQWATSGAEIRDRTPNNRHLAKTASMSQANNATTGPRNEAIRFRGPAQKDFLYRLAASNQSFNVCTIAFWVMDLSAGADSGGFVFNFLEFGGYNNAIGMYVKGDPSADVHVDWYRGGSGGAQSQAITGVDFRDGFHHVAITLDGTNVDVFVDGVSKATKAIGGTGTTIGLRRFWYGTYDTTTGADAWQWLNGTIDDFRIYMRVLSQSEIAALMQQPTSPTFKISLVR